MPPVITAGGFAVRKECRGGNLPPVVSTQFCYTRATKISLAYAAKAIIISPLQKQGVWRAGLPKEGDAAMSEITSLFLVVFAAMNFVVGLANLMLKLIDTMKRKK